MMRRPLVALLLTAGGLAAPLCAQPPSISHTIPAAVLPGQPTDLVLLGGNLAAPTGFWSSAPLEAALTPGLDKNGTEPAQVSYRLTVPPATPVGVYGLRVATGGGVSNLRLFLVDDLPSVADNGANRALDAAQEISLPVAVDGACEPESFDYYKFSAAAGQRISVEVVARRLGYPLDPAIRLLDATGRELVYSDDEVGIGADSRFSLVLPAAGTYYLELRDIRYQGGATHRYRLRIGDFPLTATTYPMGARKGTTARLQATAADVPTTNFSLPATVDAERVNLSAKYVGGQGSAMLTVAAGSAPEQIELEPNDDAASASPVRLPGAINGRFDGAKDRDFYQFDAKAGERWQFAGRARSLGSPSDLFLRIYKADGAKIAEADDSGGDDGVLDFTAPADGTYHLSVEDLLRRGGPEFVYRVAVEAYRPGFSLAADAEKYDAPRGGVFLAKVTCARRDYNGPISLAVEGAGDGLALAGNALGEGAKETVLHVTLPATIEPGRLATLRIVGRAKIGDSEFQTAASTLAPLRAAYSGWAYPPADLDGQIGLGVGPVFPDFFQLTTAPAGAVPYPQIVATANFKVQASRTSGFDGKIDVAVEGLPEGLTAKAPAIEKGQTEATVELAGLASIAAGDYPLRVVGTAVFQNQPRRVTLGEVVLRVVQPIQVTLVPAGPLAAGGKQSLKVQLTRYGDATGPVTVRFKSYPAGVSGPAEVTVAEGQNEAAVELAAAADAAAGKPELSALGSATVKNRALVLEATAVALEITRP